MGTRYGPVKLKVPKGFPVLLQRFAREVLREQPSDIAKFGADFFRDLLAHRNSTGEDPLKGDPFDEAGFHTNPNKVLRPINSEVRQNEIQQEKAAAKIQAGYRGYRVRKQSRKQKLKNQENAATKIQARYRGYRQRKSLIAPSEKIEETVEPEEGDQPLRYDDTEQNAAVRIQANFRGYQTRKSLKAQKAKDDQEEESQGHQVDDQEMEAAAVKIQASYRGYRARRHLKKEKDVSDDEGPAIVTVDDEENQASREEPAETDTTEAKHIEKPESEDRTAQEQADENEDGHEDATDDDKMDAAALKIQASYRGHRARKELKQKTEDASKEELSITEGGAGDADTQERKLEESLEEHGESAGDLPAGDNGNVAAEDGAREAAAVKIQSQYRGYRTRKQMKDRKDAEEQPIQAADIQPEVAADNGD